MGSRSIQSVSERVFPIELVRLIRPSSLSPRVPDLNPPDSLRPRDDLTDAPGRIAFAESVEECRAVEFCIEPPVEPGRRGTLAVIRQEIQRLAGLDMKNAGLGATPR
jgi:hypothetical protein